LIIEKNKNKVSHCPDINRDLDTLWEFEKENRYCGEKNKFATGRYINFKSHIKSFKLGGNNQITFWGGRSFTDVPNEVDAGGVQVKWPVTYRRSMSTFRENQLPISYVVCKKKRGHCKKPEY